MQFTPLKVIIAMAWLATVVTLGLFIPMTSVAGWATIAAFGLMPSVFMLRAWRQPTQTISESIQAVIRK